MRLFTPNPWNFQRILHTLAATQEVPRHTRLHLRGSTRGSTRVPPTSRGAPFPPPSSRGGILSLRVRERIPGVSIASQEEVLPQERREELQGRATFPESPRCLSPFQGNLFSLHCLDFQAEDRLTPRCHVEQPCVKASRESHRSLDPCQGKRDTAATAREESVRAYPHSRRGLTPLGKLQKYPKIHVSTGEESSGSGTDSTQDIRPRHQRERNPERPSNNSHGDWPFVRTPERVPEVPVVILERLPHSRKSRRFSPPGDMRPISAEASRG